MGLLRDRFYSRRYAYLTDNYQLNDALDELDNKISEVSSRLDLLIYEELEALKERIEKLEREVIALKKR